MAQGLGVGPLEECRVLLAILRLVLTDEPQNIIQRVCYCGAEQSKGVDNRVYTVKSGVIGGRMRYSEVSNRASIWQILHELGV